MTKEELRIYLENRIDNYSYMIPEHMHDAVKRYVLDHIEPGSFLTSILLNDLKEAAARADETNRAALANWASFCVNALPTVCWGNAERVDKWLDYSTIDEAL